MKAGKGGYPPSNSKKKKKIVGGLSGGITKNKCYNKFRHCHLMRYNEFFLFHILPNCFVFHMLLFCFQDSRYKTLLIFIFHHIIQ